MYHLYATICMTASLIIGTLSVRTRAKKIKCVYLNTTKIILKNIRLYLNKFLFFVLFVALDFIQV